MTKRTEVIEVRTVRGLKETIIVFGVGKEKEGKEEGSSQIPAHSLAFRPWMMAGRKS